MTTDQTQDVIGAIYEAAASPEFDAALIDALRGHFHTHSLIVYSVNSRTKAIERFVTTAPTELMHLHAERLHRSDLWLTRAFDHAVGKATRSDDYVTEGELTKTAMYNELLVHIDARHALTSLVPFDGDGGFAIGLHHTARQGMFDADAMRRLDALLPHFVRAERMRRRLGTERKLGEVGLAALEAVAVAAIACTADGRVVFANAAAERLDRARDGLTLSGRGIEVRVLTATAADAAARLRRAVADAAAPHPGPDCGGTLLLPRSAGRPLLCVVTPLPRRSDDDTPMALVLVSDPHAMGASFRRRTRQAFGFTAAEARLAEALVMGVGREGISDRFNVTNNTIKSQMRSILAKTDSRRESDLMRILLALPRVD